MKRPTVTAEHISPRIYHGVMAAMQSNATPGVELQVEFTLGGAQEALVALDKAYADVRAQIQAADFVDGDGR